MILLIDNYDSFVYNLARYLVELGCETEVVRNDAITIDEIRCRQPAAIVLSPGPCTPNEAGICVDVVRELGRTTPILGVCLGHQAIAVSLGGKIVRAAEPVHGRTSSVLHDGKGLFADLPQPLMATRYHSLTVSESSLPETLEVTARTRDGIVMGIAHRNGSLFGVQFHPESVLTRDGRRLLQNFLTQIEIPSRQDVFCEHPQQPVPSGDFYERSIERDHPPPENGGCSKLITGTFVQGRRDHD